MDGLKIFQFRIIQRYFLDLEMILGFDIELSFQSFMKFKKNFIASSDEGPDDETLIREFWEHVI